MSYASHRRANSIDELKEKFNRLDGKTNFNELDDTYWTTDHVAKDGVGEAIIRFLPAPPDGNGGIEPDDIVKYFQFSTQKNGKYYINRGRNTLGKDERDPANDYNISIFSDTSLTKEEKKKKLINRSEFYIANIYIVKDPNRPENEGKNKRWKFGRMIYMMIHAKLFPTFESEKAVNIFDPVEGADFIFRVTPKTIPDRFTGENKKVPTYELSKFADPSQRWSLEEFEAIWEKEYSLQSEIAADKFKSYEDLKRDFDRVFGVTTTTSNAESKPAREEKASKPEEKKASFKEEIDDSLPWDEINDSDEDSTSKETPSTVSKSSDDVDDWFSSLE